MARRLTPLEEAIARRAAAARAAAPPQERPVLRGTPAPARRMTDPPPVVRGTPNPSRIPGRTGGRPVLANPTPPVSRRPTTPGAPNWATPGRDTFIERATPNTPAAAPPPRRRRPVSQANPAADAVARSTTSSGSPPRTSGGSPSRPASSGGGTPRTAAPRPVSGEKREMAAPKKGTLRAKAAKSKAKFDSFDKETRNAALQDFKATHQWARSGDEDAVKQAVAYLLSKEKGRFGSQRYSDGGPGDFEVDRPRMTDGARQPGPGPITNPVNLPATDGKADPGLTPRGDGSRMTPGPSRMRLRDPNDIDLDALLRAIAPQPPARRPAVRRGRTATSPTRR